jgi:hypothetical protein
MLTNVPSFGLRRSAGLYIGTSVSEELFYLEDAAYKILGNVENYSPIYTASYHRRLKCI